ncbi:hypothetical protein [Paenarthrobacter ureafaciens]|uniref:hypothetical protein n=1 Tax=Paenarthrobacter ureafaciens TaxID=37931 RepID=UPI001FB2B6F4|nr:hypothetical protein [Paenarthrobacter ureafaciens]UOD81639.1 hypothetical protein MQZ73_01690 [Paenarthrobacter ureafaciens]UOD83382.1 hypothetical protein MQZ73_20530 [Paenarthrobacter ureafaciens]UOD83517.1 hypothetical protein MQZ73_20730 [Paenarthrobacter ureafaciens]WNZ04294.1 hypothetical protein PVT25_01675 [Paenarthrobacter ureafaciens]WNZ05131.1 hypothetical protein PVT25_06235 [Paenarthrobacter ureafaciens]
MKKWSKPARVLFWFVASILAFLVLRLLLPTDVAWFIAAIPGYLFLGYVVNLGVQQVRNPPHEHRK